LKNIALGIFLCASAFALAKDKDPAAYQLKVLRNAPGANVAGPGNPHPGRLGVIEEGALADMLLVDGNGSMR
jgi:hypothetical protein